MFRWLRPSCPILPGDKAWVETRLNWLCREFGDGRFLTREPILPTAAGFPSRYDGSEDAVFHVFSYVCELMDIPQGTVKLDFYVDEGTRLSLEAADFMGVQSVTRGLFEDDLVPTVWLERSVLPSPHTVVAVLAHELSHVRLLNERRIPRDTPDNEALTDLTAVFFGFGVFTVNKSHSVSHWSKEKGYISKPIAAYALAHHPWARGEAKPSWLSYLDGPGRGYVRSALKFLRRTGDSDFSPLGFLPFTDD